jgi:hypothetical protein
MGNNSFSFHFCPIENTKATLNNYTPNIFPSPFPILLKNITNYHKHLSLTLTCHGTKPLAPHLTRNHNRTITKFIHQIETLEHSDVITQFEASFLFGQLNKCRFLMYFHYH